MRSTPRRLTLAALCLVAAGAIAPATAATREKQYTIIVSHDPNRFLTAIRAGADLAKRGGQFRVVLSSGGVIVAIPGSSSVQRDYMKTSRPRGLEIIACKETMDALSRANRRRLPVLPGVLVKPCASLRNKMTLAGWQVAPGI